MQWPFVLQHHVGYQLTNLYDAAAEFTPACGFVVLRIVAGILNVGIFLRNSSQ